MDGLHGLIEGIAGGGAAEWDQRLFTQAAGELGKAGFLEEFTVVGVWVSDQGRLGGHEVYGL